jgi:signal transduction histidine kinase
MTQTGAVAIRSTRVVGSWARVGWVVFAATTLSCVLAVALDLHEGRGSRPFVFIAVAEALAALGLMLTTRMPQHPISWVIAAGGLWWGVSLLVSAYAVEALVTDPGSLRGGIAAAVFDSWAWLPGLALFLSVLLVLMPNGRLASRRWWPVPASVTAGTVMFAVVSSTDASFTLAGTKVANPLAARGPVIDVLATAGVVLVLGGLAGSLVAFVVRYRRSEEGVETQQLRWVGASLGLAVTLALVGAVTWDVLPVAVLPAMSLLALTGGITVAVLKYRLYELDVVVNRAAVYVVLTLVVVSAYVLAVGLVGSYVSRRGDFVVSLVVTGLVAICFQPLRERVQRVVNRLMYGERDDPYLAIAGLSRTLASSLQVDEVLPAVVETLGRTLALEYVGVSAVTGPDALSEEIAAYGTPSGDARVYPLAHQGLSVGELRMTPRPGERLRPRDERLIADLAPQVAGAVHAVELAHELESARARLVRLREEERRRIRRDLHDGLGPALAGLTFTIDAARNLAGSDLARSDELLVSATDQIRSLIADVRRLIYGLRPPTLDELGLVASLRGLASRDGSGAPHIRVDAPDVLPPLDAAVEVATYRIVQEAVTNVTRHAHARRCTIRLVLEPTALVFDVADDGRGFAERRAGVGLQTMRERALELGGTCEVSSTPGVGTTVSVRLPRQEVAV